MSGFLSKIVIKTINKVIKNTSRFDIAVDDLIDKFKDSCPPKPELLILVKQKNQIQSALSNLTNSINTLQSTADSTNNLISNVSRAVRIIKSIPIPVSTPPGYGIPIRVITILADSLDTLGDVLKGGKASVKTVPTAAKIIQTATLNVLTKLGQLDLVINKCIGELAVGLNQQERNELINEVGNAAATSGEFSNLELNTENEEELIKRLSYNSNFPFIYKRFVFNIQYNSENEFSFPQRRILGTRPESSEPRLATPNEITTFNLPSYPTPRVVDVYPLKYLTNLPDGVYSYSTSVKVLIDELKFRIDQGERYLRPNTIPELNLDLIYDPFNLPSNTGTSGTNGTSGAGNPPPSSPYFPFTEPGINNEIRFFQQPPLNLRVPYKFKSSSNSWSFTSIQNNLEPFGTPGSTDNELKVLSLPSGFEFYRWNQLLYLWREN